MTFSGLIAAFVVTVVMAVVFHALVRHQKIDPGYAKRIAEGKVLRYPRDPLLMAVLFDTAVVVVIVLFILRLFWPETLSRFMIE